MDADEKFREMMGLLKVVERSAYRQRVLELCREKAAEPFSDAWPAAVFQATEEYAPCVPQLLDDGAGYEEVMAAQEIMAGLEGK